MNGAAHSSIHAVCWSLELGHVLKAEKLDPGDLKWGRDGPL